MSSILNALTAASDLVVVARPGITTDTGGSINVALEIERVVKGPSEVRDVRVAMPTKGALRAPALDAEQRYVFFLTKIPSDEPSVYRLAADADSVKPLDPDVLQQLQSSVSRERT